MTAPSLTIKGDAHIGNQLIFKAACLDIPASAWTCLLGRSGVGKTTILKLIAGLDEHITFTGDMSSSDGKPLAGRIALMSQTDNLLPWLSVRGNIMLGSHMRQEHSQSEQADALIERVGLTEFSDRKPHTLSGGMRQRVALARTLMEDRPIMLLDEPFSALDAGLRAEMQELAAELFTGKTVLLITHDPAEAARMGDRLYLMTGFGIENLTAILPQQPHRSQQTVRDFDSAEVLEATGSLLSKLREAQR
ncbi:MAG: ABC transporter ATP-binding protein [Alphaproteobacteria bacterium]|nr:ABC transporter ATP-binding protein [Alphaproteobacteria bacterium]